MAAELSRELERGAIHPPDRSPARAAAFFLALVVFVIPVLGLAGVAALLIFLRPLWWSILLAGIVLFVTAAFRPRVTHLPAAAQQVSRHQAPRLYDVLDELTALLGARRLTAVAVTTEPVISVIRVGWRFRRVLLIGIPLWAGMDAQQRIAAVAHEICDDKGALHQTVLRGARHLLDELSRSFTAGPLDEVRYDVVRRASGADLVIVGSTEDQVVHYYLTKAAHLAFGPPVRAYHRLLDRLDQAGHQRTEYLIDRQVAQTAGSEAAAGALERALIADTVYRALERATRFDSGVEPLEVVRRSAADIPPHELARRIRVSRLGNTRSDAHHPPTHLRTKLLRQLPAPATITLTAADHATLDRELAPAFTAAVGEFAVLVAESS
ncbi:M48 family metallopeptidase [Kribbella sp. NPDC056861]|uniref:M48 family metallopeptidase n=1 Tax=Kribbella sp. NPDC056861 TaxID=3154857 RepID=UPI003413BE31